MKKVLAVIGSPRKGETYKAVQRFEEELKKMIEVEFEYIMLSKVGLADCTGCHNCIVKGQEYCHEAAKVKELQEKMLAADGVILATPVYNQHVTAIMKKFLDYFTFLWHRPAMFGVKVFGIASGGGMFDPVFKFLSMNSANWGAQWVGQLGVPHYESLTDKYKGKMDRNLDKKVSEFILALNDKSLPRPSIGRLIWFNMWKMTAEASKTHTVKDFEHWTDTGWFRKDYYYDTRVNPVSNAAARLVIRLMRAFMRKIYVGY